MPYDPMLVQPMREELTQLGVEELLTPEEVEGALGAAKGSRLMSTWLGDRRLDGFLRRDAWVQANPGLRGQIAAANQLDAVSLTDGEVSDLLAFLESLTDPSSRDLEALVPESVPSGLPVAD